MKNEKEIVTSSNKFVVWMLRSPLHSMMDASTLLVTFKGAKSGKTYTTPVNYVQKGSLLYVTSMANRTWWKNLLPCPDVTLELKGKPCTAKAQVIQEPSAVQKHFAEFFTIAPRYAKFFHVEKTSAGFNPESLAKAAEGRVGILFTLKG